MSNEIKAVKQLQAEVDVFKAQLHDINKELIKASENTRKITDNFSKIKSPSGANDALSGLSKETKKLNAINKERDLVEKGLIRTQAKIKISVEENVKALARNRYELNEGKKAISDSAKISSKLASLMTKTIILRKREADVIQELTLKKQLGNKLSDKEQKELAQSTISFNKYNTAILKAKESVGRFHENVGNYPKSMKSAATAVRSLAGALGLVGGGAFAIVSVMKDAFNRVRAFDKEMQALSGVLQVNRKDLAGVEEEITSIAAGSVKTVREVAGLAKELATLGKKGEGLKTLIAPVNNLAIAMETTGAEAAEFLIGNLNAFEQSDDKAKEFANTISAIRSSTSLDFTKMKDSFQYLTPIANILNKDLAYSGAIIGVLNGSTIKAEAGARLLGTGLQRLAKNGNTLDGALKEINTAINSGVKGYDLLKIATKLFGAQAAKVGIVLAKNIDVLDKSAQSIRDNKTALDDLVNTQLESLESKVKLLDSAWEGLVTTIENGQGSISSFFKGFLGLITSGINKLTEWENAQDKLSNIEVNKSLFDYLQIATGYLKVFSTDYDKAEAAQAKFNKTNKNLNKTSIESIKLLKEELILRYTNESLSEKENVTILNQIRVLEASIKTKKKERKELIALANELGYVGQSYDEAGKITGNFYLSAGQASTRELKIFVAANKERELSEDKKNKKIIESRKKSVNILDSLKSDSLKQKTDLELKGVEVIGLDEDKIKRDVEEILKDLALLEKWAKEAKVDELLTEGLNDLGNTIEDFTGVSGGKFLDFFSKISEGGEKSFEDLAELAKSSFSLASDVSDAFFQGKIEGYQEDIDANNEYYENLLNNEKLNDKDRERIEADRDNKNKELQKKQAKEKEKAAKVNKVLQIAAIGVDLARTIVAINLAAATIDAVTLGVGGAAYRAANLPLAIGVAAAQASIIATAPIPKFAEGGVMDHDGKMKINDHSSGRLEIVERDGKFLMSTQKNAIVDGKKGDIIHKDAASFFADKTDDTIIRDLKTYSIIASMQSNNFKAQQFESKKIIDNNKISTDRIVKAIKSQKTRFNMNQNINLADDLRFLRTAENTL